MYLSIKTMFYDLRGVRGFSEGSSLVLSRDLECKLPEKASCKKAVDYRCTLSAPLLILQLIS